MASKNTVCQMCEEKEDAKNPIFCKLCGTPSMDRYCLHNMPRDDNGIIWKCDECTSQNRMQPLRDAPDRTHAREKGKGKATDFQNTVCHMCVGKEDAKNPIFCKLCGTPSMDRYCLHNMPRDDDGIIWKCDECTSQNRMQPLRDAPDRTHAREKGKGKATDFQNTVCHMCVGKEDAKNPIFCKLCGTPSMDRYCLHNMPRDDDGIIWKCDECTSQNRMQPLRDAPDRTHAREKGKGKATDFQNTVCHMCVEKEDEKIHLSCKLCGTPSMDRYCQHNMPIDDDGIIWKCDECTSQNRMQPLRDAPDRTHAREKGKGKATDFQVQETEQQRRMLILPKEGSSVKMSEPATVAASESNQDHAPAKPNTVPIWRGRCEIHKSIVKVVARSSTKCGSKVTTFARAMPRNLKLKMVSKRDVWSTTFELVAPSVAPTVDSIHLYLFPDYERGEGEDFSNMVQHMANNHLALKTINSPDANDIQDPFADTEILVFSSRELPVENWYIEGKYYLWAVIREKSVLAKTVPYRVIEE